MITTEQILNDKLIKRMFRRKNLKEDAIDNYRIVLTEYCNLLDKTPSELIHEAKEEKRTIVYDYERSINDHIDDFQEYLQNRKLMNSSRTLKMRTIIAFYNYYKTDPPEAPKFGRDKVVKKREKIIEMKHIQEVMQNTGNNKHKAIITFLCSSGLRSKDMRLTTLEEFVEATREYHSEEDINDVIPELEGKPVIPCWDFENSKRDIDTITFNTPECVEYIIKYLKSKEELNNEDYLFSSDKYGYDKPFSARGLSDAFTYMNKRNNYPILGNGVKFFHPHGLRAFFGTTITNKGVPYSIVKKMMGHSFTAVDSVYVYPSREACKEFYEKNCVEALTTTNVKYKTMTSKEMQEIIERLNKLENKEKARRDLEEEDEKRIKKFRDTSDSA